VGVDGSVGGKQLSEGTIVPILSLQPMIHTIINSYKEFKVLLDRYKKVTADFNLSLMDVYNIDFFKLKYLKGKYYYLNKIINFMPQKISKCELIEATDISLLSTVDLIPPTNILSIWVTLVSDTSLTLNWSESFDDTSVTYEVYKNDVLITTQSGRTYPFTGLLASTTYSFKVRAKDTGNNLSAFIVTTATTTAVPADLTPPAMPTGVVVTLVTSSSLRLSWNANADSDIYGYRIYKNGVADLFISHPTILYNYTNLLSNTNYQFRLSAVDTSNNESALTSIVSATTLINYTSFDLDVEGYVTNTNSCSLGFAAGQTKWHNGSGAFPTYGDIVYTTSTGVVVYNGGSLWYKIQGGVYGISINIGTNGVINDLYNCTSGGEKEM
jgi:chitodextrinase